ncbi:MAG TPA: hypothetical protein VHR86_08990, partial [Armatimonadota bacterium]|nr:hypothetical protein [Armatimonadota bacterium]
MPNNSNPYVDVLTSEKATEAILYAARGLSMLLQAILKRDPQFIPTDIEMAAYEILHLVIRDVGPVSY